MKKSIITACILAGFVSVSVMAAPVATVNGQAIDKSQVDVQVKALVERSGGQVQDSPALREDIKNQLITQVVVEQEAKKRGLDKSKDYQQAMTTFQSRLLSDMLAADIAKKNSVSDADVKKTYDQAAATAKSAQEVKLRQIVTNKEEDAKKALAELNRGKSFESVAKTYSMDGSKDNGGLIDSWENLAAFQQVSPPVFAAVNPLTQGQYTKEVININGNFALFKVEGRRNAIVPAFNDVKDQIKNDLLRQKVMQEVEALRQKATIK